eukprot:358703-Chlamydomonas_euryale.AAC.3
MPFVPPATLEDNKRLNVVPIEGTWTSTTARSAEHTGFKMHDKPAVESPFGEAEKAEARRANQIPMASPGKAWGERIPAVKIGNSEESGVEHFKTGRLNNKTFELFESQTGMFLNHSARPPWCVDVVWLDLRVPSEPHPLPVQFYPVSSISLLSSVCTKTDIGPSLNLIGIIPDMLSSRWHNSSNDALSLPRNYSPHFLNLGQLKAHTWAILNSSHRSTHSSMLYKKLVPSRQRCPAGIRTTQQHTLHMDMFAMKNDVTP